MNKILNTILAGFACLAFAGCGTFTPFESGVITAESAKLAFDAPQDEIKFQKIKGDIQAVLASDMPITQQIVLTYVAKLETDFSPAFIQIVMARLEAELPDLEIPELGTLDDSRIRQFLAGVEAAL